MDRHIKAEICIVNFNCGFHTSELIDDLLTQTDNRFMITLYDQDSKDEESLSLYKKFEGHEKINTVYNGANKPLNHVWNSFAESIDDPNSVMLFLNNDIRVSRYHVEHTLELFQKYGSSLVAHVTNNARYQNSTEQLSYVEETKEVKQGWEFSILKKDWTNIPESLKFYCGDDFIFHTMFKKNILVKVITSSPIIHKLSQTRQTVDEEVAKVIKNHALTDIETYKRLRYPHYWNNIPYLSRLKPEFEYIKECEDASS